MHKKHEPVPINAAEYGSHFLKWWKDIQPDWRIQGDLLCQSIPDSDKSEVWASLRKGGSAGLYMVVIALSWWLVALGEDDNKEAWVAVEDITWVIWQVCILSSSNGRKHGWDMTDPEEGRRKQ